jgi:hypothetical protein
MAKNKKDRRLQPFFDMPEWWAEAWEGMPEYSQEDLSAYKSLIINFDNKEDMALFAKLINQKITFKTKSIWYPQAEISKYVDKQYIDTGGTKNKS